MFGNAIYFVAATCNVFAFSIYSISVSVSLYNFSNIVWLSDGLNMCAVWSGAHGWFQRKQHVYQDLLTETRDSLACFEAFILHWVYIRRTLIALCICICNWLFRIIFVVKTDVCIFQCILCILRDEIKIECKHKRSLCLIFVSNWPFSLNTFSTSSSVDFGIKV